MTETETQESFPVEVTVRGGELEVREGAADYGSYQTFVLTGTEAPFRIARFDANRARAYITVTGTGPVYVGTEAQCESIKAAGAAASGIVQGALIATGITLPVTHKQELWLVPDGTHSATVTIAQERWV